VARQKVGGTDLTYHYLKQFPVLPTNVYSQDNIDFIVPRVLELTYTAVDLIPFAEDLWDSADSKMRMSFLEQRHGEKAAVFEEFTRYDTAHLPEKAKVQGKQTGLSAILPPFLFLIQKGGLCSAPPLMPAMPSSTVLPAMISAISLTPLI
jgi:hypothetical protein